MLLKTRFYLPPLRKNGVLRKTLLESLDQSQGGDLVVVSAPPGYGKSTLVSQWLHLRPQRFGENPGVMFDMVATVTESPEYRGVVGAFIADEKLYVLYFLGATPYYYEKHVADATAIIQSARI